jgi:hexosaminidase
VTYRIPPPGLVARDGVVEANHAYPGFTLRYTTDGSDPQPTSPKVTGPILDKGRIAVAAFNRLGRCGRASFIENP